MFIGLIQNVNVFKCCSAHFGIGNYVLDQIIYEIPELKSIL